MIKWENLTEEQKDTISHYLFIRDIADIAYECFHRGITEEQFFKQLNLDKIFIKIEDGI